MRSWSWPVCGIAAPGRNKTRLIVTTVSMQARAAKVAIRGQTEGHGSASAIAIVKNTAVYVSVSAR